MKVNKEHFEPNWNKRLRLFKNLNHKIITTRKSLQAESSLLQLLLEELHLHFNFNFNKLIQTFSIFNFISFSKHLNAEIEKLKPIL